MLYRDYIIFCHLVLTKLTDNAFKYGGIFSERNGFSSTGVGMFMDCVMKASERWSEVGPLEETDDRHNLQTDLLRRLVQAGFKYAHPDYMSTLDITALLENPDIKFEMDCQTWEYTVAQQAECVREMLRIVTAPLTMHYALPETLKFLESALSCLAQYNWGPMLLPAEWNACTNAAEAKYDNNLPEAVAAALKTRLRDNAKNLLAQELPLSVLNRTAVTMSTVI